MISSPRAACVALLAGLAACSGGPTEPTTPPGPPLAFVAGANAQDTIGAKLAQALIVEVRDSTGRPLSGVVVRFESVTKPVVQYGYTYYFPTALVGQLTSQQYASFAADTTDSGGRASVLVQLGQATGPAGVVVSVPMMGLVDTARFTVLPGAVARIVLTSRDTIALAGSSFTIGAQVTDRLGNARTEKTTFSGDARLGTIGSDGHVTVGTSVVQGYLTASYGTVRDSARLLVVPNGLAAVVRTTVYGTEVGVTYLDGTGYRRLGSLTGSAYPALKPGGGEIAYQDFVGGANTISVVDVATSARRTLLDVTTMPSAGSPRYSADGSYIWFAGRSTLSAPTAIWRVKTDGTGLERITPATSTAAYSQPQPSPDGLEVAYVDGTGNVLIQTLATGAVRTAPVRGTFPRYSSDGRSLAALYTTLTVARLDGSSSFSFPNSYDGAGGLTWCPGDACLLGRDYGGLALSIPATGQVFRAAAWANFYQLSF